MTDKELDIALSYPEREAVHVLRKALVRKPQIIELLLKGQSQELATRVLVMVRDELSALLQVNRAFSQVAAELARQAKQEPSNEQNPTQL